MDSPVLRVEVIDCEASHASQDRSEEVDQPFSVSLFSIPMFTSLSLSLVVTLHVCASSCKILLRIPAKTPSTISTTHPLHGYVDPIKNSHCLSTQSHPTPPTPPTPPTRSAQIITMADLDIEMDLDGLMEIDVVPDIDLPVS